MVCIYCGGKTGVFNSRHQRRTNRVWRRRRCDDCLAVFSTEESAQYDAVWRVLDQNGGISPFSRDKLLLSLYKSCEHRPEALRDAAGLVDTVINKLLPEVKSGTVSVQAIIRATQVSLNRFDKTASIHYQAYHKHR